MRKNWERQSLACSRHSDSTAQSSDGGGNNEKEKIYIKMTNLDKKLDNNFSSNELLRGQLWCGIRLSYRKYC